jgi:hypothetical protein
LGIEPLEVSFRELAGDIVSPQHLQEAPDRIRRLLNDREEFVVRMRELRPQMVFNIGRSIELGAEEIARLADERALERHAREKSHA